MPSPPLPQPRSEADLASHLTHVLGQPVRVLYGRSRTRPVQARWAVGTPPALELRLARFFAAAPAPTLQDLTDWLRTGRRARAASERLDRWIDAELALEAERSPATARRVRSKPAGLHHDLEPLAAQLLAQEFRVEHGDFPLAPERWPALTWGRRGARPARHSLRLGSWVPSQNLVRVHPVLDQEAVPDWFVQYILFHELLHAALPPVRGSGTRWIHHHRAFREAERSYRDYDRAQAWQALHLGALLRSVRTGDPVSARRQRMRLPELASARTDADPARRLPQDAAREPDRIAARSGTGLFERAARVAGRLRQGRLFAD